MPRAAKRAPCRKTLHDPSRLWLCVPTRRIRAHVPLRYPPKPGGRHCDLEVRHPTQPTLTFGPGSLAPSRRAAFGIQSRFLHVRDWARGVLIWPISSSGLQTLGRRLAIQDPGFTSLRFFGTTELRRGLSNEQVQFAKCPTGIGRAECRQLSSLERADILRGKVPACPQLRRIAVECDRMCRREGP
jgi:hypothetical protein